MGGIRMLAAIFNVLTGLIDSLETLITTFVGNIETLLGLIFP